ncbi:hypothetical protein VIGAN_01468400, partial [Vigna angularis var. angularis]
KEEESYVPVQKTCMVMAAKKSSIGCTHWQGEWRCIMMINGALGTIQQAAHGAAKTNNTRPWKKIGSSWFP